MTTRKGTKNGKPAREAKPPRLIAFHVVERGESSFWTRIGAAWDHEDGKGMNVQLDLVPVNDGRIVLREPKEDESAGEAEKPKAPAEAQAA